MTGNFLNLDGSPYSYIDFSFEGRSSEEAFTKFFPVETDGGFASFTTKTFSLACANRDYDLDTLEEIFQDDDIDIHIEGGVIAKKGIQLRLDVDLIEDCHDFTL